VFICFDVYHLRRLPLTASPMAGHRILWPRPSSCESGDYNIGFMPTTTGKGSPGWITVTEHKISQSFDLTRVMFSRGNVTEKKRFASLVQPGERVLDMYAGIGYYTLPALIHGKADHVTACEWNPHALFALRYNLKANGVVHKATVLEGDCRLSLRDLLESLNNNPAQHKYFDRVSLGLLPSSEGGWDIAVACLNQVAGGWLHIHGNVPCAERGNWSHWVCQTLKLLTEKYNHREEWHAICVYVEKVKSFAPKVDHVVADVFVGPLSLLKTPLKDSCCSTGVIDSSGAFNQTKVGDITPPSCALNKEGILHQDWLISSSEPDEAL
jgi:ribosomal protein L11 methylase PrmA